MFQLKRAPGRSLAVLAPRILPVALLALAAAIAAPGQAAAQPYPAYRVYPEPPPQYQHRIPPHEVAAIVRSLGLMPTSGPRQRGPFWVMNAVGQDGSPIRVSVDGRTGRVTDIVRTPGPRMVRVHPDGPPRGDYYDAPPPPGAYGAPPSRGMNQPQPGYYDDNDDDYPPQGGQYGPRGSNEPPLSGPRVVTREGITNSIPQRQVSRGGGSDPLLGVPREFRGEQKPKPAEKKVAAKPPAEKTPAAPLPRPRPADAPSVAKNDAAPASTPSAAAPQPKSETVKPGTPPNPGVPPVQGFE